MSILMVFLLSLTIVHGQDLGVNGLSDTERQMMQEYKKGNINSDEFIAIRKSGSLTLAHSQNSQMSFMYGFFFVNFLFFTVVCVVIVI